MRIALALGRLAQPQPPAAGAARRPASATSTSCRRRPRFVGNLQNRAGTVRAVRSRRGHGHQARLDTCSPSSALDRAPRLPASSPRGSSCPGSATGWPGCPAVAGHRPGRPRHRVRRRHDQGHRGRPAAHRRRRAWSPCSPSSTSPATRCRHGRRRPPATRSARSPPPPSAGVAHAPSRPWCFVRERGRAMAAAQRRHPDRHERRPRRRPRTRCWPRALQQHGLTAANVNGGGQVVAAGTLGAARRLRRRAAGQGAGHPAEGGRRLPHPPHGARGRGRSTATPGPSRPHDPAHPAAVQPRRRRGRRAAARCSTGSCRR